MADSEAFCLAISSSINLLILKSVPATSQEMQPFYLYVYDFKNRHPDISQVLVIILVINQSFLVPVYFAFFLQISPKKPQKVEFWGKSGGLFEFCSFLQWWRINQEWHLQGRQSAVKTTSATSEASIVDDQRGLQTMFRGNVSRQKINPCHGTEALVRMAPL